MSYAAETWEIIRKHLSNAYSEISMNTWFDEVSAIEFSENKLWLCCDNDFKRNMIESHFLPDIRNVLKLLFSQEIDVSVSPSDFRSYRKRHISIFDRFTFDAFLVGESNSFAYSTARAVTEWPAIQYNPLLLYGGSGLGKTHLMQAIANDIRAHRGNAQIVSTCGSAFTNDLVEAIQSQTTAELRKRLSDADLLLVDDIQFIAGKQQTQEEFFNVFNTLYMSGCQIVLTSDKPPKNMQRLDERLRTRFESGIMAEISSPDYTLRREMVSKFAADRGLCIDNEMMSYIAESLTDNVRQIEGVIKKIGALQAIDRHPLTSYEIKKIVGELTVSDVAPVTVDDIVAEASRYYGVEPSAIRGKSRARSIVTARNVVIYLASVIIGKSSQELGAALNRDHSTVLHSVRQVSDALSSDGDFAAEVEAMKSNILSKHKSNLAKRLM